MTMRTVAQLGETAAAAAAAGSCCFDAAQSGGSLWVAARSAERAALVAHAVVDSSGNSGSRRMGCNATSVGGVHSMVTLPEPVAAVQLGVPTAAAEAEAGTAVLLVVGDSCRVWAFQLRPPSGPAGLMPAEAAADDSAAVAVPLSQPACPARHQLAAAVAWEHLCSCWESGLAGAGQHQAASGRSRSKAGSPGSTVAPLSLAKLAAALQRYGCAGRGQQREEEGGEVLPLLVHSVASWACELPAAACAAGPAVPSDTTAAAYLSLAAAAAGGPPPRLACSARFELPDEAAAAAVASGATSAPIGYLLLATGAGQMLALPVGLPYSSELPLQPEAGGAGQLPLAVCYASGGGSSSTSSTSKNSGSSSSGSGSILFLQLDFDSSSRSGSSKGGGSAGQPQELVLLPESGQLVPALPAGLGSRQVVAISARSTSSSCGSGGSNVSSSGVSAGRAWSVAQLCQATVQLVGLQAAAAAGSNLWYLPLACGGSDGSGGSQPRCLDASSGILQQAAAADMGPAACANAVLIAAAAGSAWEQGQQQKGQRQQQQQQHTLFFLTRQGAVLAGPPLHVPPIDLAQQSPSTRSLESHMQGLLGRIAQLSEEQEKLGRHLLDLDSHLARLAAAIATAQSVAAAGAAAAGGSRLHCTLRPLRLRSQVLGSSSSSSGGSSSGSGGEVLDLELSLFNASRLLLAGGSWSVLLACRCSGSSSNSDSSSNNGSSQDGCLVLAAPLGSLAPGAEWRRDCQVPLPSGLGSAGGQLTVLLCRHSSDGGSRSTASSSSGSCMLLLHSMQLDALHLLGLGPTSTGSSNGQQQEQRQAHARAPAGGGGIGDAALKLPLLVQLPISMGSLRPAAGPLLQQLLEQGLSSQTVAQQRRQQQQQQQQQQQPAIPFPAFSLLLPPPTQQGSSSRQGPGLSAGSAEVAAGGMRLSAQLLPATARSGASASQQLLKVEATASDPAALLACHQALCRRALHMQQAAAAEAAAGTAQPWPVLAGGGVLLPPELGSNSGADVAAGGGTSSAAAAAAAEAWDQDGLEQALLQLRRLKDAAVRLRNTVAEQQQGLHGVAQCVAGAAAEEAQHRREQQRGELQQLALAGRAALVAVPVLM